MKSLPFLTLFAILIFASSYVSTKIDAATQSSAPASAFRQFRLQRQGVDISLSWSVSSIKVVAFAVERSYDGEHFETIGSMECGGTTLHKYNDIDVAPGTVYYRVDAVRADESVERSTVEATQITQQNNATAAAF